MRLGGAKRQDAEMPVARVTVPELRAEMGAKAANAAAAAAAAGYGWPDIAYEAVKGIVSVFGPAVAMRMGLRAPR